MKNQQRIKMDCNWIVKQAIEARNNLKAIMLENVTDIEQRVLIKSLVRNMDYQEVCAKLKALNSK
ncbi:MAG: hypothetical protein ACRC3J_05300 [Culicoidibacterales bacterium]